MSQYREYRRIQHIGNIMKGPIRTNENSGIYFVPTCPQYNSIAAENVREFPRSYDAEKAGFQASLTCEDAIIIRRLNESGTYDDTSSMGGEDPR